MDFFIFCVVPGFIAIIIVLICKRKRKKKIIEKYNKIPSKEMSFSDFITKKEQTKPTCPVCKKSNYHVYVTSEIVEPEKVKKQTTLNLNPLKPFTIYNHKEKIVQKEIRKDVSRFVCNECGTIFDKE